MNWNKYADESQELLFAHYPERTDVERIQSLVERKYCLDDLQKTVSECTLMNTNENENLHNILADFQTFLRNTG
jgi:hypothetical protein